MSLCVKKFLIYHRMCIKKKNQSVPEGSFKRTLILLYHMLPPADKRIYIPLSIEDTNQGVNHIKLQM